jgi:hypothetical protein
MIDCKVRVVQETLHITSYTLLVASVLRARKNRKQVLLTLYIQYAIVRNCKVYCEVYTIFFYSCGTWYRYIYLKCDILYKFISKYCNFVCTKNWYYFTRNRLRFCHLDTYCFCILLCVTKRTCYRVRWVVLEVRSLHHLDKNTNGFQVISTCTMH